MSNVEEVKHKKVRSISHQKRVMRVVRWIFAAIMIAFALFPVIWLISASLNPTSSMATQTLIPENANFNNYKTLVENPVFPFFKWMWNSIKVTSISTFLSLFITTLAAYAFSRFRFNGRQALMKVMLILQVFPSLLSIVAIFSMISEVGDVLPIAGLNTHLGLILVYMGGAMSINIWLMKGYMDTIPKDIDESAMVDGATHWQTFTQLILPLLQPILVVVGILSFIGTYGDFILARILLTSADKFTLMVGLQIYTSGMFSQKWGVFAAGAIIGAFPIVVAYLLLQDYIVGGLTVGAVKG